MGIHRECGFDLRAFPPPPPADERNLPSQTQPVRPWYTQALTSLASWIHAATIGHVHQQVLNEVSQFDGLSVLVFLLILDSKGHGGRDQALLAGRRLRRHPVGVTRATKDDGAAMRTVANFEPKRRNNIVLIN